MYKLKNKEYFEKSCICISILPVEVATIKKVIKKKDLDIYKGGVNHEWQEYVCEHALYEILIGEWGR